MIYLDNNATTRPSPGVVAAMHDALENCWHNPSSIHRAGQLARQKVELARKETADLIGAKPRQIVFTASGTESIDLVIRGLVDFKRRTADKPVVITTPIEHGAVRELVHDLAKRGVIEERILPVKHAGLVDADALPAMLEDANRVACVSVMWANNETGVVQPIDAIGTICRQRNVTFHCDGTQWVGKMPTRIDPGERSVSPSERGAQASAAAPANHNGSHTPDTTPASPTPIDVLTFAPHKFYGPKGVGMVWLRRGVRLPPQIHGSQELGRRGGTENVPGIVGAGVACREAREWLADPDNLRRQRDLRDHFEQTILEAVPGAVVNGPACVRNQPCPRMWNTSSIGFPRLEAEALLMLLSEMGLCASAGSACSSGSLEPSPVLLAMGCARETAHGSIRFSISRETTRPEIDEAVRIILAAVNRLKQSVASLQEVRG
ncbi:MAG: cysteine desulfurase [Phycisphaeraceae bacterium]|nr:cysteine desulfurase [Phycisphaeraceae bacterium]